MYQLNTHCANGESVFEAVERAMPEANTKISLDVHCWRDFVLNQNAQLPRDIPVDEGWKFIGFVTVRQNETFPVFAR